MTDVKLDTQTFFKRAGKVFSAWEQPGQGTEELKDLVAIQVLMGEPNDEVVQYTKTSAMQTWLLGYEFPSTLMIFSLSPRRVTFTCSSSKAKILQQLSGNGDIEIDVRVRGKDDSTANVMPDLAKSLGEGRIGYLQRDKQSGKFADEWSKALDSVKGSSLVDVSGAISDILAEKDGEEMKTVITSSRLTSTAMIHYFKGKMESIIDRGTKMSHEEFAGLIEEKIGNDDKAADMKLWNRNAQLGEIDFTSTEWMIPPIIQSGGKYDLRLSAQSNQDPLKPGVILCTLGMRYKNYCSSMGRTFMIDPHAQQEKYYNILVEARNEAFKLLKPGAVAKDVYESVVAFIKDKSGNLAESFVKSIGFATGIEYRDSNFVLGPKNGRQLKENMVLILNLGCSDLPNPKTKSQKYSLTLTDTIKIGQEGAINLTEGCFKLKDVVMQLEDDAEEEEDVKPTVKPASKKTNGQTNGKAPAPAKPARAAASTSARTAATKTRGAKREQVEQTTAEKIKANQSRLHAERQSAGLKKFESGGNGKGDGKDKVVKRYESYRREEQLPRAVEDRRVHVDEQRSTVVLPIYGYAVPFHISTIKNATKTEEGEYIVLRINFQSPGQIAGKKEDMPFENPDATFIRSASFRSKDHRHMLKVYESITGLKKAATKREAERKEMADVIEQEKLLEVKGRHPYVLKNVYPRPAAEGKKTDGNLEIHQNGVRFRPDSAAAKIDVLFSNVQNLFFQPSDKELIVLIHFHLRSPIMLGKKKTYDVQFYREVTDMSFDETGGKKRRARYGDEDEIEQEQEDRRRRQELDKTFHEFARRIQSAAEAQQYDLEVDVPFRELGFSGVPFRSNVMLLPTTNCLIHLSEYPFTVITLTEVELVHLERVQFGLKNFDMVFVLSDFKKTPVHINNIPVVHLDNVKEWLDSCDVAISEGPVNLSWPAIMKTVNDDPYGFYEEGGWTFLTGGGEESESESSEGSVFTESGDDASAASSSESGSESDFDDDSGSDESGSFDEDESGEDWDELERKAKKSDDKHHAGGGDDSDDGKPKKKGRR